MSTNSESPPPNPAHVARARTIAHAFACTAEHHRRTALLAGFIALGGCALAFVSERVPAKGAALGAAILFAVFCFRAMRASNSFVDPSASPVLRAVAHAPSEIVALVYDPSTKAVTIRCEHDALVVRTDERAPAEPLLAALVEHAPHAEVVRP